ncbi:multidrug transporter [Sphingomonas deserti]|uniref:Multidrug transporter n=2 Tax=Allosphingosinicella deserti TaxID=2116704 RepID=A0A2P7R096_9SPHN|nr:multidrug transporter [Sphingomonas deserti]
MPKWELLDHQQHAKVRISRACDESRHFAQVVASEFVEASIHYPVVFTKNAETGAFYAGVIMGLEQGRNLLTNDGALPGYRPADLERQGFFVTDDNIVIDLDNPAFSAKDGLPLFEDNGEPSPMLMRVQRALGVLHAGLPDTEAVIGRLVSHRLLEPIDVVLNFDDGKPIRLDGLYTVSLDSLHALPDAAVLDLFRAGDLQLAYCQTSSIGHLRTLAKIRNDRLPGAAP